MTDDHRSEDVETRSGFCALVGLANVGKSTLLNRLVGEKLAIVTPKTQTTRRRLSGIFTDERGQVIFVDTPGLLEPRYLLQEAMRQEALDALEGADAAIYVADCGFEPSLEDAAAFRPPGDMTAALCLNKADRAGRRLDEMARGFREGGDWHAVVPTVATRGQGVDELRAAAFRMLPPGPPLYPADQLATASLRELAAEFVRECCFGALEEEVPYSVAVEVSDFREDEDPVFVRAVVFVERESQKGIVIGQGGGMIRRIGTCARKEIEPLVGRQVYLDLHVKVLPKWRKRPGALARFGLPVPHREEER